MPSAAEHEKKKDHNWEFVSFLEANSAAFNDWVVTGLFYIALHQVDRYFALSNKHFNNHHDRNNWISRLHALRPIWPDYRDLQHKSRTARYDPTVVIQACHIADAKDQLETVETHIEGLL